MTTYETPELVELGDARELTLGFGCEPYSDACDCLKKCDGDIIIAL